MHLTDIPATDVPLWLARLPKENWKSSL